MTYTPLVRDEEGYFKDYSLRGLDKQLHDGLIGIATLALCSFVTTTLLIFFLFYRLFLSDCCKGRRRLSRLPSAAPPFDPDTKSPLPQHVKEIQKPNPNGVSSYALRHNQALILIFNLLLADLQQAVAFVLNFHWVRLDGIFAPSQVCSAQGWFVLMGDLSSGVFSLAIACHTFALIVYRKQLNYRIFCSGVVSLWMFCAAMSLAGPLIHRRKVHLGLEEPRDFFVRADAWCWVNEKYEDERLFFHYMWIFICECLSLVLYAVLFYVLRHRIFGSPYPEDARVSRGSITQNQAKLQRIARSMLVYPIAYTLLTLPLAGGRMATSAGHRPPQWWFIIAGACMGSCGWVDVMLYTSTRRVVVVTPDSGTDHAYQSGGAPEELKYGSITTIIGLQTPVKAKRLGLGRGRGSSRCGRLGDIGPIKEEDGWGNSSRENIRLEQIVEITVDHANAEDRRTKLHDGQHPWSVV